MKIAKRKKYGNQIDFYSLYSYQCIAKVPYTEYHNHWNSISWFHYTTNLNYIQSHMTLTWQALNKDTVLSSWVSLELN